MTSEKFDGIKSDGKNFTGFRKRFREEKARKPHTFVRQTTLEQNKWKHRNSKTISTVF